MKNHLIFTCLLSSIIPHAYAMQSMSKEEFELKRKAGQDAMVKLNNYLDLNKPNDLVETAAAEAASTEIIKQSKYYWYDAKPLLHASIALKLAETKACHAAKLACERHHNVVKHFSAVATEEHEKLCSLELVLQRLWINAELNVATIAMFEESFKEQAKCEEKQRQFNNFQNKR